MVTRRRFIQAGVAGTLVLAAAGAWLGQRAARRSEGWPRLDDTARGLVAALAPVLLAGALPQRGREAAIGELVGRVEQAIGRLGAAAQRELLELFTLLGFAPARIVLAGVMSPWPQADPRQVARFLERLRGSRLASLQSGYHALHDLVIGSWYAGEQAWAAIGYPGPPELE